MATKTIKKEYANPRDAQAAIEEAKKEAGPGAKIAWIHTEAPQPPSEGGRETYQVTIDFDVPAA